MRALDAYVPDIRFTMIKSSNEWDTSGMIKIQNKFSTSAVEAKQSEVLKDTQATLSCMVTGLTKELDSIAWEEPTSGKLLTNGVDGYKIEKGTYHNGFKSQTTILTIPATKNKADSVYACVIASIEHAKSEHRTLVNSNVFSK